MPIAEGSALLTGAVGNSHKFQSVIFKGLDGSMELFPWAAHKSQVCSSYDGMELRVAGLFCEVVEYIHSTGMGTAQQDYWPLVCFNE
jgi:hypothetical protein